VVADEHRDQSKLGRNHHDTPPMGKGGGGGQKKPTSNNTRGKGVGRTQPHHLGEKRKGVFR